MQLKKVILRRVRASGRNSTKGKSEEENDTKADGECGALRYLIRFSAVQAQKKGMGEAKVGKRGG